MSRTNLAETALLARIRDKLNADNVKLWIDPFYDESLKAPNDGEILALAARYATEIEAAEEEVVDCLYHLQRKALERLEERDLFRETGVSTVRIKLSGAPQELCGVVDRLRVNLSQMNGGDLKKEIAELLSCSAAKLKLISHGRVVDENQNLEMQNIKNGSQVMVIFLQVDESTFQHQEDNLRQLQETKDSANYLASLRDNADTATLQVADQTGKTLNLPESEKRYLAVALALHEKGRAALKSNDFSKALVFLLEADSVYSQCQSSLLERVDNYGILNLDIAWCYLCLESIAELPQVEMRLSQSEQALKRSYGDNMERVLALKGSNGWEAALFIRLHLLQGIVAYHQGHIERSKFLLKTVDQEIKRLQVSDEQLAQLINMGYSSEDAKLALRATFGDVSAAVNWIIRKRDDETEAELQNREDSKRRRMEKKLGLCDNGEPVSYTIWASMKEMGFNGVVAAAALRRSNNNIDNALVLVSDNQFITDEIIRVSSVLAARPTTSSDPSSSQVSDSSEQPSTSSAPLTALSSSGNAAMKALEQLENEWLADSLADAHLSDEERLRSRQAHKALAKDSCSEAEYIDLNMSSESSYIQQYKELLHM